MSTVVLAILSPWLALLPQKAGAVVPVKILPSKAAWPHLDPWLWKWLRASRTPVLDTLDPVVEFMIGAVLNQQPIEFKYWGGSEPGQLRRVTPSLVFQIEGRGPMYLAGYCHARQQQRIFQVEKMEFEQFKHWIIE